MFNLQNQIQFLKIIQKISNYYASMWLVCTIFDQKLILPNVISDAQPIQCPTQLKIESFIEAKFKAIRENNTFF